MTIIQTPIRTFLPAREPPLLGGEALVSEAVELMHRLGRDSVIVIDETGRVSGMFTERDFLNRVVGEGLSPHTTPVGKVMTPSPEVLGPAAPISYAINLMAIRRFRNVPIVDEDGRPSGLLGVRDVIRHLSDILEELDRPVEDPATSSNWIDIGGGD